MADFQTFDLGRVLQTANLLKAQQQQAQSDQLRNRVLSLQADQAQREANQQQGVDQTLATNPNPQLSDFQKYGQAGLTAYSNLNQAQQQQILLQNRKLYVSASQVAASDDPITTVKQVAPDFPQQYDAVHGAGSFDKLTPQQVKEQANLLAQHAQLGLVDPEKQWEAKQQILLAHFKQDQANQRSANSIAAANSRQDKQLAATNAKQAAAQASIGDPNLQGDAFLQSIPDKGLQGLVQAIAEGREQVPRIYRSGNGGTIGPTEIAAAVSQYDPTFNAQDFNSRNRMRISATSGPLQKNMTALNQVSAHLGQLADQVSGTAGHAIPFVGGMVNAAENAVTDPYTGKVTKFNSTADAVAHELRSLFVSAGGGSLQELNGYLSTLKSSGSTQQKMSAIQNIADLVRSRIGILKDTYQQGMGKAGGSFDVVFPHAQQTLDALSSMGKSGEPVSQQSSGGAVSQSAPAEITATGPNGQRIALRNGQWVPFK